MQQAKTRDKKIEITDIAISKADTQAIPHFSEEQNSKLNELHKELLRRSMNENDSNEVAFLFNTKILNYEVQFGDEASVDIFANPFAFEMLNRSSEKELYLLHNHPSTKSFSYTDIGVFLMHDNIGGITVVTNTGDVHILYKSENYSFEYAYEAIIQIRSDYSIDVLDEENDAEVVKRFLKVCKKCGIISM